jgi:hypothetical protein
MPQNSTLPEGPGHNSMAALEAQIELAEYRLVAREQRLRLQRKVLVTRFSSGLMVTAGKGLVTAAGGVLMGWLFRPKHKPHPAAHAAAHAPRPHAGPPAWPWRQVVLLAWPLAPRALRNHWTAASFSLLIETAASLWERVLPPRRRRKPR